MTEQTYVVKSPSTGETQPPLDADSIMRIWPKQGQQMILDSAKHDMIAAVHKSFDDTIELVTGNASIPERDTWKSKEEAARALIAGKATPAQAQMIGIEAQYRGEEPAALAQSVIAKADGFLLIIALASGVRSKSISAIEAATTPAQLEAAAIQGRKDMAEALAQLPQ